MAHRAHPTQSDSSPQDARLQRGMNFWTDVKDWLGGYPIEFSEAAEVIRFVQQRCGLETWTEHGPKMGNYLSNKKRI